MRRSLRLCLELSIQLSFQPLEGNHLFDFTEFLFCHELVVEVVTKAPNTSSYLL